MREQINNQEQMLIGRTSTQLLRKALNIKQKLLINLSTSRYTLQETPVVIYLKIKTDKFFYRASTFNFFLKNYLQLFIIIQLFSKTIGNLE